MSQITLSTHDLISPENIGAYILENYGIDAKVRLIEGRPAIKVNHHFSLATIINKIRHDFDFQVFHKAGSNEYIIYLNAAAA